MTLKRKMYLSAARQAAPIALLGLKIYTTVTRRPRVRVVVENEKGQILLLRNVLSRSNTWMFPGGGVGRNETMVEAAERELYEETGVKKPLSQFSFLFNVTKNDLKISFDAPVFYVKIHSNDLPSTLFNPLEIAEVQWFSRKRIPPTASKLVQYILDEEQKIKRA